MSFGSKIKNRRVQLGLSLGVVAKHLQITVPYLSDVENNKRHPFRDVDKIKSLASVLDLSEDVLIKNTGYAYCKCCGALSVKPSEGT
jgi:transcriptional regulator with XRE-family HTH domain